MAVSEVALTDLYWKDVAGSHQISEELYAKCTKRVVSPHAFEQAQRRARRHQERWPRQGLPEVL